jgi:hypothetical protein
MLMVPSMSLGNGNGNMRGVMNKLLIPKERVVERTQGCWNCTHWDAAKAKPFWTERRQLDLTKALELSLNSSNKQGEDHPHVVNIRRMVDNLDHMVASGSVGMCEGNGRTANGDPVGDLVAHSFLCDRWSGTQGASIAREGQRADLLPEELEERLDERLGRIDTSLIDGGLNGADLNDNDEN